MTSSTGTSSSAKNWKQIGEEAWKRMDKINGELFALTYGCLVAQIYRDQGGNAASTNTHLEKIGYNIGVRLIDDLLARVPALTRCTDFKETAEVIKLAFRLYLNHPVVTTTMVKPTVSSTGGSTGEAEAGTPTEFIISIPLVGVSSSSISSSSSITGPSSSALGVTDAVPGGDGMGGEWVALPEGARRDGLHYSNVLVGIIKGALEMVNVQVQCSIIKDPHLTPLTATEINVKFVKFIEEELPPADD